MSKWRPRGFTHQDTRLKSRLRSHSSHSPPRFCWDFGTFPGERVGRQKASGAQPFCPQVKSYLCLGFCLKTYYVETVKVGWPPEGDREAENTSQGLKERLQSPTQVLAGPRRSSDFIWGWQAWARKKPLVLGQR